MSRGLGALQREIVDTLEGAKEATADSEKGISYRGCETCFYHPLPYCEPGWVLYQRHCAWLAEHVFDLGASSAFLMRQRGISSYGSEKRSSFLAAFSRAVKSLLARGVLQAPSLVPIQRYDKEKPKHLIQRLADGLYLSVQGRVRFVVVQQKDG